MTNIVPEKIETERLILRQFREDDWQDLHQYYSDESATKYTVGKIFVMGIVGFWYPNDWPSPEIKWALSPEYWGKGFAKEAAKAVQRVGREYMPNIPLISLIHSKNHASKKLAIALGSTLEKEVEFRNAIFEIYRHPK